MATLNAAKDQPDEADVSDLDDMQKYAPLIPIFGAVETLFDTWEKMVRDLEIETEPAVWTKKLNRVQRRAVIFRHGEDKPQRSRIRRRINRIEYQKGNYQ